MTRRIGSTVASAAHVVAHPPLDEIAALDAAGWRGIAAAGGESLSPPEPALTPETIVSRATALRRADEMLERVGLGAKRASLPSQLQVFE